MRKPLLGPGDKEFVNHRGTRNSKATIISKGGAVRVTPKALQGDLKARSNTFKAPVFDKFNSGMKKDLLKE